MLNLKQPSSRRSRSAAVLANRSIGDSRRRRAISPVAESLVKYNAAILSWISKTTRSVRSPTRSTTRSDRRAGAANDTLPRPEAEGSKATSPAARYRGRSTRDWNGQTYQSRNGRNALPKNSNGDNRDCAVRPKYTTALRSLGTAPRQETSESFPSSSSCW